MAKKQFKAESKRLLDLMINSIYTHKEIFLRELISNASDAIDKLYYRSLQDGISGMNREDFSIRIDADKDARTLTITDNGIGMTKEELEKNLGTIARSGSLDFKSAMDGAENSARASMRPCSTFHSWIINSFSGFAFGRRVRPQGQFARFLTAYTMLLKNSYNLRL